MTKTLTDNQWQDLAERIKAKQATLVSGTNIKTINSSSILGSGNISIPVITVDSALSSTSTNPVQNKAINTALSKKIDNNDIIQNLNNKSTTQRLYISTIDNCLYSADQRYTVTGTGFKGSTFDASKLFNGTFEDYSSNNIDVGGAGTIVISGTAITGTYRQGYMLISFYSGRQPAKLSDVTITIENTAGNIATPALSYEGNDHVIRATVVSLPTANAISKITVSIANNRTSGVVAPVGIEYFSGRLSSLALLPAVLKNTDNTLYGNITAPKFIKTGGTSSQFLKADGSIDSNAYAKTSQLPTIDSALSSTSTNPVQNKVIYSAIGDIETILNTLNSGSGV